MMAIKAAQISSTRAGLEGGIHPATTDAVNTATAQTAIRTAIAVERGFGRGRVEPFLFPLSTRNTAAPSASRPPAIGQRTNGSQRAIVVK
jgi:TctA family transporter